MKNTNQFATPLFDALVEYVNNDTVPFHVPGHKKGNGMAKCFRDFVGMNVLSMDVTVFKSVDSLHNPKGPILKAQELAADAYGADQSFFCVHGTSGAIQVMIMSVVGLGDKIIVPRNVHKSVAAGIILSGSEPVYMQPEIDESIGVALNVTPQTVEAALAENPDAKAVLIINPTYYGVSADIAEIADIVHRYNIPLIVDEAHGPHLKFHNELPISAMEAGADMCAQSTHKLIGAMTQGSILHVKKDRVDIKRVKTMMNMMHTTSPSYILMASLDTARMQMATEGEDLLTRAIELSHDLRRDINDLPGLYSFGKEVLLKEGAFDFDPTKITINCRGLGISGYTLERILADEFMIQVEMSDLYNILAVLTIGDDEVSTSKLLGALKEISERYGEVEYIESILNVPSIPPRVLSPRDALYSKTRSVALEESIGAISAEMVMAYPPGIPILCQGEIISEEIVQYIKMLKMSGLDVQGTEDTDVNNIRIIDEQRSYQFMPTA